MFLIEQLGIKKAAIFLHERNTPVSVKETGVFFLKGEIC